MCLLLKNKPRLLVYRQSFHADAQRCTPSVTLRSPFVGAACVFIKPAAATLINGASSIASRTKTPPSGFNRASPNDGPREGSNVPQHHRTLLALRLSPSLMTRCPSPSMSPSRSTASQNCSATTLPTRVSPSTMPSLCWHPPVPHRAFHTL